MDGKVLEGWIGLLRIKQGTFLITLYDSFDFMQNKDYKLREKPLCFSQLKLKLACFFEKGVVQLFWLNQEGLNFINSKALNVNVFDIVEVGEN